MDIEDYVKMDIENCVKTEFEKQTGLKALCIIRGYINEFIIYADDGKKYSLSWAI